MSQRARTSQPLAPWIAQLKDAEKRGAVMRVGGCYEPGCEACTYRPDPREPRSFRPVLPTAGGIVGAALGLLRRLGWSAEVRR